MVFVMYLEEMTSPVPLLQNELAAESATMLRDPYQGGTFREKYFTPNNKVDDERPPVAKTTAATGACFSMNTTHSQQLTTTSPCQQQGGVSKGTDVCMTPSGVADT